MVSIGDSAESHLYLHIFYTTYIREARLCLSERVSVLASLAMKSVCFHFELTNLLPLLPLVAMYLTTPGAALERLAQAPGRPREIIGYARSAEGIRGRAGRVRGIVLIRSIYMRYG